MCTLRIFNLILTTQDDVYFYHKRKEGFICQKEEDSQEVWEDLEA